MGHRISPAEPPHPNDPHENQENKAEPNDMRLKEKLICSPNHCPESLNTTRVSASDADEYDTSHPGRDEDHSGQWTERMKVNGPFPLSFHKGAHRARHPAGRTGQTGPAMKKAQGNEGPCDGP